MVIDSHVHFWNYDAAKDLWMQDMPVLQKNHLPEDLLKLLASNAVDASVAVQAGQSEEETNFLTALATDHSFIKGVVGWMNLQGNDIEQRLEYFSDNKTIKGWRHIVQAEPKGFLLNPAFQHGISLLSKYNYCYDILIHSQQLQESIEFVSKFPDQKFVIDHAAKPNIADGDIKEWAVQIKLLAQYPNVYCKLSGLLTEAKWNNWNLTDFEPYLDVLLNSFGSNRLMFGSDWPVVNVSGSYDNWKLLITNFLDKLSLHEQQKIWANNAIEFYGIS